MSEMVYKLAFASLKGLDASHGATLLSLVGDEEQFFSMTESQLISITGIRNKIFSRKFRDETLRKAEEEADYIALNNIKSFYFTDPSYPMRLTNCEDAPMMIFGLGECDLNSQHIISIVGTRHATAYGLSFVGDIVADLASSLDGVVITSGLAYGIDIAAHRSALDAGVPTLAVVAHGLATIYPSSHRSDAVKIARGGGMIITEYTHNSPVHKGNFLARNRIVAGIADCTIVVESATKGGALVTARIASEYGRDVMALPGRRSDLYSQGCNKLIANNTAALIESAGDLIRKMGWTSRQPEGSQPTLPIILSDEEQKIYDYLSQSGESSTPSISAALDMPVGKVLSVLMMLESKGSVISLPGGISRLA